MNINKILLEKGWSQYRLAKESGVPIRTIGTICNGKVNIDECRYGTLKKIAKALDIQVDEIDNQSDIITVASPAEYRVSLLKNRKNVVLTGRDALCFGGYGNWDTVTRKITVHSTVDLDITVYDYVKVPDLTGIDYSSVNGILVQNFNQAVNDVLASECINEQFIQEVLGDYYYSHNNSFEGLEIEEINIPAFNKYAEWAVDYWEE